MNNEMIYEKADNDYFNLCEKVQNFYGSFKALRAYLGGHNFEDDMFDVNFGCICATITNKNGTFIVNDCVEVWDEKNCELVNSCYKIN